MATTSSTTYQPPPGRLGNLTPQQESTLELFRTNLQNDANFPWDPKRHGDADLLRWLRARKFDLRASTEMIHKAEKWRKDFGVDEIVKSFKFDEKPEVNKYYPQYYHKTDKDGRPIYIEVLGQIDVPKLYSVTNEDRLLKRFVLEYERFLSERLPAASAMVGHPVETSCTILDLNNVGVMNFYRVKDYVFKTAEIGQNYYPECMGKFYIINAPYLFSGVFSVIKTWLDEVTVAKIQVMSTGHQVELAKQIPRENLPKGDGKKASLGGTCECVEGCQMSDAGPWKDLHEHPPAAEASGSGEGEAERLRGGYSDPQEVYGGQASYSARQEGTGISSEGKPERSTASGEKEAPHNVTGKMEGTERDAPQAREGAERGTLAEGQTDASVGGANI